MSQLPPISLPELKKMHKNIGHNSNGSHLTQNPFAGIAPLTSPRTKQRQKEERKQSSIKNKILDKINQSYSNDELCCFPDSMVDISENESICALILNCCTGSCGTIVSACQDRKGFNYHALLVGVLQTLTMPMMYIGWVWGIYHAYILYKASKGKSY